MNQYEAKRIFLQSLPELSEPLKSAVEFTLARWHRLDYKPTKSDDALTFLAKLSALPTDARTADKPFIKNLDGWVRILRDDLDVWLSPVDLPHEEWRAIADYKGLYEVSNYGRIKSLHFGKKMIRKIVYDGKNYATVDLNKNGKTKCFSFHGLVAKAFIPNPENKPEVNHERRDTHNNCIWNLNWTTHLENQQHAVKTGAYKTGLKHSFSKLTVEAVRYIRKHYIPRHREFGASALARKFDVSIQTIVNVATYKTYHDVV